MSLVFQNIDPPPRLPGECVLPPQQRRGVHTRRAERGSGGSIFWKTRDTGLPSYTNNPSTGITIQNDEAQQNSSGKIYIIQYIFIV
jgi:hypothetical protein